MKKLIAALILTLPLAAAPAFAADARPTAKQTKKPSCDSEAGDKTGNEREAFIQDCRAKRALGRKAQQEKMKTCSAANKGKKGEEYKQAQKDCLSK